jgi:hypothetical protein
MDAVKRPGYQGANHEHLIPTGKRRVDPKCRCRGEPEPGVIGGVPDDDHNPVPQLPAGLEPFLHKNGSNTLALMFQAYGKRCKGNCRYVGIFRINRYRGKENMPDNLVIIHGNEREIGNIVSVIPEGADKPGFAILAECLEIYVENGGYIRREFRSDKKRIHPVLWVAQVQEGKYRGLKKIRYG